MEIKLEPFQATRGPLHKSFTGEKLRWNLKTVVSMLFTIDFTTGEKLRRLK